MQFRLPNFLWSTILLLYPGAFSFHANTPSKLQRKNHLRRHCDRNANYYLCWAFLQDTPTLLESHSNDYDVENNGRSRYTHQVLRTPERFSVAPMMAHTNRHYHYFFRYLSKHATLYTEMIPATQILSAYKQQFTQQKSSGSPTLCLDEIPEMLRFSHLQPTTTPLDSLLKLAPPNTLARSTGPVVLQLGGRDPDTLAFAAAIGTAYGYDGINLNCGCPSNAVSSGDRSGGAALMREPALVATCVESMSSAISRISELLELPMCPELSVKHRIGVHDAATYDAEMDRRNDDTQYFLQCRDFIQLITLGSDVTKVQVHARLALLGDFEPGKADSERGGSLWVPGREDPSTSNNKVDHNRLQYSAKKRARQATIRNRSVPPLRPGVVDRIANEFPKLEVITNGGILSMGDIESRLHRDSAVETQPITGSTVAGTMVGRAAINHPCSFGGVDSLLWDNFGKGRNASPTRESVLLDYIQYCNHEEEVFKNECPGKSLASLRRRLVAVPFHLFVGELGNGEYQRRIRKLISRPERHTSAGILIAALAEVPIASATKPVDEYTVAAKDIPTYTSSSKRSGPLQRMIS